MKAKDQQEWNKTKSMPRQQGSPYQVLDFNLATLAAASAHAFEKRPAAASALPPSPIPLKWVSPAPTNTSLYSWPTLVAASTSSLSASS